MYGKYKAVKGGKMGDGTSILEARKMIEKIGGMMNE